MSPEFNLIQQYFTRPTRHTNLGVGDDAALISLSAGMELAISADMLVAGTHFFADCDAEQLGWKSLAVNISDMAAMGANAKWATLAIALPDINHPWLAAFSQGFFACADAFNVDLIGGDTTRGPLTISVQMMGEVPAGLAIKRSGAKIGDDIWVSGQLGGAAIGLAHLQKKLQLESDVLQTSLAALHSPTPRAALGVALRSVATSCIDISDGLLADLGHILKASNVGATLNLADIPCHDFLRNRINETEFQQYVLAGGEDYELCFTAPSHTRHAVLDIAQRLNLSVTRIGNTSNNIDLRALDNAQLPITLSHKGFDHFAN
ncbi:MAG TPA: thiamine-phosphate kinase [Methylotenera sp.]|nr:thiamine-phosphate kinase [Methylotenera sp.]HPH05529.1 thiamine-phosphate kinase [Methylotenera sp.]HPN00057.1 thiamine-phosphate kinase [Methylotenera sp.]